MVDDWEHTEDSDNEKAPIPEHLGFDARASIVSVTSGMTEQNHNLDLRSSNPDRLQLNDIREELDESAFSNIE